jgi:hypothetical protein
MKDNLYLKIFAALFLTFSLVSCEDDDEPFPTPSVDPQPEVQATLSFNDPFYSVGGSGNFTVDIGSSAVPRRAFVESVVGTSVFKGNVIVPAGESSATGALDGGLPGSNPGNPLSLGYLETAPTDFTYSITGVQAGEMVENEDGSMSFVPSGGDESATSSVPTAVNVLDRAASSTSSGLDVLMDWPDPVTYDLDLQIIDRSFTQFGVNSGTGSRYEGGVLSNARPDDIWDVYVIIFGADLDQDVEISFFFATPDGEKIFLQTVLPAGSFAGLRIPVAEITKVGSTYSNFTLVD